MDLGVFVVCGGGVEGILYEEGSDGKNIVENIKQPTVMLYTMLYATSIHNVNTIML